MMTIMAIDVTSYLDQRKKKNGKLDQWEAEIFQLFHAGASYQDIVKYLNLNDTSAKKIEVYRFIHRKKRRHLVNINADGETPLENGADASETGKANTAATAPNPQQSSPQEDPARPGFNWRHIRDNDKPTW